MFLTTAMLHLCPGDSAASDTVHPQGFAEEMGGEGQGEQLVQSADLSEDAECDDMLVGTGPDIWESEDGTLATEPIDHEMNKRANVY